VTTTDPTLELADDYPNEGTPEQAPAAAGGARFAVLAIKQLVPHPKNVRVEVGDVGELAASIKAQGVLQPLVVAPAAKKRDRWIVIAGHRRLAGAKVARLAEVPCMVREDLVDEADQLQAMLVENGHRVDLTPVEEGDAYRVLTLDYGVPVKDLAAKVGRSQQLVRGRITLAGSPESVRTRVITGQVPMEQAIELAAFEDDHDEHEHLTTYLGTTHWAWALQTAKDARDAERARVKEARAAERAGARQLEARPDGEVVAVLAEVAEAAGERAFLAVAEAQHEDTTEDEVEARAQAASTEAEAAFTPKAHATCPGHCVYLQEPSRSQHGHRQAGLLIWACDQPDLHANATGWETQEQTGGAERDTEEVARRAEAAQQETVRRDLERAHLAAAAKVRRRHLGEYVRKTTEKPARLHLVALIADTVRTGGRTAGSTHPLADVLSVTLPPPRLTADVTNYEERQAIWEQDGQARADVVTEAIAGWGLVELVGLLSVTRLLDRDGGLEGPDSWEWRRQEKWLRQVAATGYEWSPVEREFLPEAMRAELNEAETAAAEAAGS